MDIQKFNPDYVLLKDMYEDEYFPTHCVDKVADLVRSLIAYLEEGGHTNDEIQEKLDEMTLGINDLMEYFEENDSEIETVARDSIGTTVGYILDHFHIDIDVEEAIRERDW